MQIKDKIDVAAVQNSLQTANQDTGKGQSAHMGLLHSVHH